jgi:hypothetical protein
MTSEAFVMPRAPRFLGLVSPVLFGDNLQVRSRAPPRESTTGPAEHPELILGRLGHRHHVVGTNQEEITDWG